MRYSGRTGRIIHCIVVASILFVSILFVAAGPPGDAGDPPVSVEVSLASDHVWVGEPYEVIIKIVGVSETSMIFKEEAAFRGSVSIRLFDRRGKEADIEFTTGTELPGDYRTLLRGESTVMRFMQPGTQTGAAGSYSVRVAVTPTKDRGFTVRRELSLYCAEIAKASIMDSAELISGAGEDRETIKLMNVRTADGFVLVYRRLDAKGVTDTTERLFALDRSSRLLEGWRPGESEDPDIEIVYNRDGILYFTLLDWFSSVKIPPTSLRDLHKETAPK